jgi:hypothetical protein
MGTMIVVALALAGCGSSTTTTVVIRERVQQKTYLPASGIQARYVEPTKYSFYIDGAVVGKGLKWRKWGSSMAIATGTIDIRDPEGNTISDRLRYPGSIEASGLKECRGAFYYTQVLAKLPPNSPYYPEVAMPLLTPCRDPESLPPIPAPPESKLPTPGHYDARFESPSGNIICSLSPESATCEILRKAYTPPVPKPSDCMLDYGHRVTVDATGTVTFDCYGDSMSQVAEQVLPYGEFLMRGRMTCQSEPSGVTCGTETGAFKLSAQQVTVE